MTYEEAIEATVSREHARREVARHDVPGDCSTHGQDAHASGWEAFLCDNGDHQHYEGATVLGWLGY